MLTNPLTLCVVEWWCYDEVGHAAHRLAVADRQEGLRRAGLHTGAPVPFAFGVTAIANEIGDDHDVMARGHPGRIVSLPMRSTGGDSWRVRIAADPIWHASGERRMDRFYWSWGE